MSERAQKRRGPLLWIAAQSWQTRLALCLIAVSGAAVAGVLALFVATASQESPSNEYYYHSAMQYDESPPESE